MARKVKSKKKAKSKRFTIDCTVPVDDHVLDLPSFVSAPPRFIEPLSQGPDPGLTAMR